MTTTQTDGERLVRLEEKVDNLEKLMVKIDGKTDDILKEQNNVRLQNVTRTELEAELKRIESAIEVTKRRHSATVWITTTLASIISIIMTMLLTYFISTIGR